MRTTLAMIPLLLVLACTRDERIPENETGSESSSTETSTASLSVGETSRGSSSDGETSSGGESSSDDGGFINPTSATEGSVPGPLGSQCAGADDCESGFCFALPMLGGLCSECLVDTDCAEGTCSIDVASGFAICSDGGLGRMCNGDEGCQDGLVCAELIDAGGIINTRVCSECATDEACGSETVCVPTYDFGNLSGFFSCVPPGSVATGGGCNVVDGEGDDSECLGGHCSAVDLLNGLVSLGVCSDCEVDTDCLEKGQTCTPAAGGLDGIAGGVCNGP